MIKLRHIEIFYATMIQGSVSGAARMLNLTQPAATRLLQHAEHSWGFPLFERIKNKLIPTQEARQLFPEVEKTYQQLSVIHGRVKRLKQQNQTQIRVASTHTLTHSMMPNVVAHLKEAFPQATPEVYTARSHVIVQQMLEGEIDLAMLYMAIDHPRLIKVNTIENPLYSVYPESWDIPQGTMQQQLQTLTERPMVFFPSNDPVGHVITTWFNSLDLEIRPSVSVHNLQAGLGMVERGLGWSILDHALLYGSGLSFKNTRILSLPEAPSLHIHIIRPTDRPLTPLVERCIEGMNTWLSQHF